MPCFENKSTVQHLRTEMSEQVCDSPLCAFPTATDDIIANVMEEAL